jgi:hypothetical protein
MKGRNKGNRKRAAQNSILLLFTKMFYMCTFRLSAHSLKQVRPNDRIFFLLLSRVLWSLCSKKQKVLLELIMFSERVFWTMFQPFFVCTSIQPLPVGTVASRPWPFLAAGARFLVTVTGKGGHAAVPHHDIDPIIAASSAVIGPLQTAVCYRQSTHDCIVPLSLQPILRQNIS